MKNMKKLIILILGVFPLLNCLGQNNELGLAKELIKEKNITIKNDSKNSYRFAGNYNNKLLIAHIDSLDNIVDFLLYDENTRDIIEDSILLLQNNKKIVKARKINNDLLIAWGLLNVPDSCKHISLFKLPLPDFERQDIWVQLKDTSYIIASFPYAYMDKGIESKMSDDTKYLICNRYYAGIDILANPEDNIIMLYDITRIEEKIIHEKIISCERCYNTYIFNDTLIFGKEFIYTDEFGMDYTYSNIYKTPLSNINDTIIIARNIKLLNISSDGKYILGTHKLYGKELTIMVDVTSYHYQYIIGRQYHLKTSFYSMNEKKFAFDFGNYFIYIDFPNQYPYDAMMPFKPIWKKENEKFWQNHSIIEYKQIK
jgi:hypothetical protein